MLTGVMIDNREPANITALAFGGCPKITMQLECGDLWASTDDGEMLIVERKTPADLLGSIKDNRLFAQCAAIHEKSKWAYLVITGALAHTMDGHVITDNRTTGWRFDDVMGALLTCQELGVCVVNCQSDSHYEEAVMRLARRKRGSEVAIQPRVQAHILGDDERILMSCPAVGYERSGVLLTTFGTAGYALSWLTEENTVTEVAGIGNGTKAQVRRALGLKPDEYLAVMNTELSRRAAELAAQNESIAANMELLPQVAL